MLFYVILSGKEKNMNQQGIQQIKQQFGIVGNNEDLLRAIDVAMQVASTDLSALITGESGVGKESFPKIIHRFSHRKHNNYIPVNCGAIPEGTIDSELFGHEKGAFTGAVTERKGYFEQADGGTIFLDEVGELPLPTQARLLRVLESGEFIKVGSSKVQKTDVRIVAATNVKLDAAISEGRFREDLFYRLNTVPIKVPALRERSTDIVLLFRKFAADFAQRYQMPPIKLTEDAKEILMSYRWPGNVRQLKNVAEQISVIEENREITIEVLNHYLPEDSNQSNLPALIQQKSEKTFESEREILYQVLFDMRRDMMTMSHEVAELKKMVNESSSNEVNLHQHHDIKPNTSLQKTSPTTINISATKSTPNEEYQDAAEYIEESLALDEIEKEVIGKALLRHRGKRKAAARDLNISERTLYRKIKEYGLDKNA
jgi:DNA-binding NtrC family response regulator